MKYLAKRVAQVIGVATLLGVLAIGGVHAMWRGREL